MPFTPCPHCKQQIEFNAEDIGLTATCPYCRVDFELRAKKKAQRPSARASAPMRSFRMSTHSDEEDEEGGGGWLIWIGIIVLLNFLCWILDLPFWFY
jgi:hypothetical protein